MALGLDLRPRRTVGQGLALCGEGVAFAGSWLRRLGEELGAAGVTGGAQAPQKPPSSGLPLAPVDALQLAGWLWGEGNLVPSPLEECLDQVRPFSLNGSSRLLHLGAGPGAMSLAIARSTGCKVSAFDRNVACVSAGAQLVRATKRVTLDVFTPEALAPGAARWDHVFGRFALHPEPDRADLLAACRMALRAGGQAAFVDYAAPAGSPGLVAWLSRQPGQLQDVWPVQAWRQAFAAAGLDLRIEEDISARHRAAILAGWHGLLTGGNLTGISKRQLEPMVAAAERWMTEAMLLQTGALEVRRFHAILPA